MRASTGERFLAPLIGISLVTPSMSTVVLGPGQRVQDGVELRFGSFCMARSTIRTCSVETAPSRCAAARLGSSGSNASPRAEVPGADRCRGSGLTWGELQHAGQQHRQGGETRAAPSRGQGWPQATRKGLALTPARTGPHSKGRERVRTKPFD
jgi:hypothetical protein